MTLMRQLRHPKEKLYGPLISVVGGVIWVLIVLGVGAYLAENPDKIVAGVLQVCLVLALLFMASAFARTYFFGHYVLLGPRQLPGLHAMVQEGATALGMAATPRAFLYNSNGVINAFATRLVGRAYVMLTSSLVDADTDAQVRFVVGHELGHHLAGHLNPWKRLLKLPGSLVPLLGAAYHRSRELTADRVGAYLADDREASCSALAMLACGSARMNATLSVGSFAEQEAMVPGLTGFLLKILSGYPRLTTRVLAVSAFHAAGSASSPRAPRADPAFAAAR